MSVWGYLTARQSKRRYRELLQRFVHGEELDSLEVEVILEAANKSEADLQNDVATLEQRALLSQDVGMKRE